ncbi:MAG: C10 family peptidase [bacterium]|nr:MAG: C10 family peptidase [bacterium]
MKFRRRYLYMLFIFLVMVSLLELVSQLLKHPNVMEVVGESPFLLTTSRHQIGDYSKYVEYDIDAGCWATAIAQISHFHRLNPTGKIEYTTTKGKKIEVDLDDYSFDHDQFANNLNRQSTTISKDQVAKYIYIYCYSYLHGFRIVWLPFT